MERTEKESLRKQVGTLLRLARKDRSLNEIGTKIGVSASYLSDLEHGHRAVSAQRLHELSQALDMDDAAYLRLFATAKMLPPKTYTSALLAPKTWGLSYTALHSAVQEVLNAAQTNSSLRKALGEKTFQALEHATRRTQR